MADGPKSTPSHHNSKYYSRHPEIPRPASAKATSETESIKPPLRQSTLLWGSLGVFASIVLAVMAAVKHDLRWLLGIAYPFAVLIIFEVVGYLPLSKRTRIASTIVASVAVAGGLGRLYSAWTPTPEQAHFPGILMEGHSKTKIHDNFNLPSMALKDDSQADVYDNIWGEDPTPWLETIREARLNRELVRSLVERKRIELQRKWSFLSEAQRKAKGQAFDSTVSAIEDSLNDPQKLNDLIRQLEVGK